MEHKITNTPETRSEDTNLIGHRSNAKDDILWLGISVGRNEDVKQDTVFDSMIVDYLSEVIDKMD